LTEIRADANGQNSHVRGVIRADIARPGTVAMITTISRSTHIRVREDLE